MSKSANQRYKEYIASIGGLSFSDFLHGENEKQFLNLTGSETQTPITDSLHTAIDQLHQQAGLKTKLENKYILGIDQKYVLIAGIGLVLLGGFVIYKNIKK